MAVERETVTLQETRKGMDLNTDFELLFGVLATLLALIAIWVACRCRSNKGVFPLLAGLYGRRTLISGHFARSYTCAADVQWHLLVMLLLWETRKVAVAGYVRYAERVGGQSLELEVRYFVARASVGEILTFVVVAVNEMFNVVRDMEA